MRIAVIGSGIAGMGSAWLFSQKYDVTLFEKDSRIGGHAHTVDVQVKGQPVSVDTGFIVYNTLNYPNLMGLFDALNVETIDSDMSFAASINGGACEYEGSLKGLVAQPSNLLKPRYWQMISGLVRFYRTAVHEVKKGPAGESLADYITRTGLNEAFVEDHLLPMAAAIWSCPEEEMMRFPARSFIKFMENHRLLDFTGRPVWRTVKGGSRGYVTKIKQALAGKIHTQTDITGLRREAGGVMISIKGEGDVWFDKVVMAAHADQSLKLISDASDDEKNILGAFDFQPNQVYLHGDRALMPKRTSVWASWNYLSGYGAPTRTRAGLDDLCVSYWMNKLQSIPNELPLFVTLNPPQPPKTELIYGSYAYDHPVFDQKAIDGQQKLPSIQGKNGLFFAGAWTRYGFHEDGLASAVAIAKTLGVEPSWQSPTTGYQPMSGQMDAPLTAELPH